MSHTSYRDVCLYYLERYAAKDMAAMESLFAEDIILRDWKIRVVGKEIALAETRKNFEAAHSIQIDVLATYEDAQTVAAELKIVVDNTEELYVVDVITFTSAGKIASIRAYLGRGDH
ncbi:MAG TPA: hypothetical protein DCE41_29095 [Cytophagales bacterium]|nr:hypothetical protein [Cytophagales bacterium]HAA18436.1 hypothetical protein [Cytophagales bacterium]HAP60154.1 hypothetical protein [Cytophagales bacterium]